MTLAQTGVVPDWLDRKTDPCADFFAYACGGFLQTAQIPPDRASWGAIQIVTKDNEEFLHHVLEGDKGKLGTYFAACMDEPGIEKAGIAPIQPLLDAIAKEPPAKALIALQADGYAPFFQLGPQQDFADATKVIAAIDQSGLGLPDKKYYLENSGTMPKTREIYRAHQVRMFALLGRPKSAAENAYRIEETIARAQQDEVTRRDPHAVYHRVDRAGLETKIAPSFAWGDYLAALGIPSVTAITVNDPA